MKRGAMATGDGAYLPNVLIQSQGDHQEEEEEPPAAASAASASEEEAKPKP